MVARISYELNADLFTARGHNEAMREVNREVLERQRDKNLPKHFKGGATERYGYRKRTLAYVNRKRKKYGHSIPLVWTGGTRDAVLSGVKITATRNGGRLKTRGRFPMSAEMRSEIERISPDEMDDLLAYATNRYAYKAGLERFRRKRKRKGSG